MDIIKKYIRYLLIEGAKLLHKLAVEKMSSVGQENSNSISEHFQGSKFLVLPLGKDVKVYAEDEDAYCAKVLSVRLSILKDGAMAVIIDLEHGGGMVRLIEHEEVAKWNLSLN